MVERSPEDRAIYLAQVIEPLLRSDNPKKYLSWFSGAFYISSELAVIEILLITGNEGKKVILVPKFKTGITPIVGSEAETKRRIYQEIVLFTTKIIPRARELLELIVNYSPPL